jgi:cyclopropane fatty-acyl-phospholipid synthase-like methyltransferase
MQTTGCSWTGITVSKAQLEEAAARVKAAGLAGAVTLLLCDYRDAPQLGAFDKVFA